MSSRRRSLGGELLSIERDDIVNAIELVQKAPGVRDVAVFGSALHVLVDDAATARARAGRLPGRARHRRRDARAASSRRWRTASCTLVGAAAQARGERGVKLRRIKAIARQGKPADRARPAQPDDRAADSADADVHARLRHQSGHRAHSPVRVRPRKQPAVAGLAEAVCRVALLLRAQGVPTATPRLRATSTTAAAGSPWSSPPASRKA